MQALIKPPKTMEIWVDLKIKKKAQMATEPVMNSIMLALQSPNKYTNHNN